jgi:hypothetical protein
MHPNVRAAGADRCAECGMTLVPIPDRAGRTYWLDVAATPAAAAPGKPVRLQLSVRDRESLQPVTHFEVMHDRPMHLFVVSSDLEFFTHVHPEPVKDGAFDVSVTLPKSGAYRVVADVLPTGGAPQTLQHTLVAGGTTKISARATEPSADVLETIDGGVRARLVTGDARAGGDAHIVVELADAETGEPVTDLQTYMAAWGHMFLASLDLHDVVHSHPLIEETKAGGPTITFQTLFARAGWYRVWTQVQRRGRLLTFGFTVRVPAAL